MYVVYHFVVWYICMFSFILFVLHVYCLSCCFMVHMYVIYQIVVLYKYVYYVVVRYPCISSIMLVYVILVCVFAA